jgi:hypothetical protein
MSTDDLTADTADASTDVADPTGEISGASVWLRVLHPFHRFDASTDGVPIITNTGTQVPAEHAAAVIGKAKEIGVTVEKVTG